jgi:peptidase C25-like protein
MSPRTHRTIQHFSGVFAPGCVRLHRLVSRVGVTAFAKRSRTLSALMVIGTLVAIHAAAPSALADCPCVSNVVTCTNQFINNGASIGTRIQLDAVGSTACPTVASCGTAVVGSFKYIKYTFTNSTGGATPDCFTVTFSSGCDAVGGGAGALMGAAYLTSFDPTNVCTNYIADMGLSTSNAPGDTFSFSLANGATAVVVVFSRTDGAPCTLPFQITISPCPLSPTVVSMDSLTASSYRDGRSLLEWKTGLEVDNLGFNIYREDGIRRTRLNSQLLSGSALLSGPTINLKAGGTYSWLDNAPAGKNTRYWIEDIDLNGESRWHGPISVDRSKPLEGLPPRGGGRNSVLSAVGVEGLQPGAASALARTARAPDMSPAQFSVQSDLAIRPTMKLQVKGEGWYRVTQPELAGAGFDTRGDPRLLHMYVDGQQQAISVSGEADGRFDAIDAIEFYGLGLDSAVTGSRTYWLASGSQPGLRIEKIKGKGSRGAPASFPYTVERRDRSIYFAALRNGDKENFFGAVIARDAVDQAVSIQHLDSGGSGAELELALQGVTDIQHRVKIELNGVEVGAIGLNGQARGVTKIPLGRGVLKEGQNIVRLTALGGESDISLVDYTRITYPHTYTADGDVLRFTAPAKQQVSIDGFTNPSIRVMDVTDPAAVREVAARVDAGKASYSVTVSTPKGGGERLLMAFADSRANGPVAMTLNRASNLREPAVGADLVIITHRDFLDTVTPLKALRESQGYRVVVADVEDIYDEFNFGQKSPQAVKDFLAFTRSSWLTPPRYALLVGDASLDPLDHYGFGDSDFVPTKLIDTALMETASDNWFAEFKGDGSAEIAIGRLPVRTADEAAAMITKIVEYDRSEPVDSIMLVSDSADDFDFEALTAGLRSAIPRNLMVREVNRGHMDAASAEGEIIAGLSRGQKIVNYVGHGNVDQWKGRLLTSASARDLTNSRHLPLFVMMTCLNGYFQDSSLDSLAESLMKTRRGGAVAVFASSGMTAPPDQSVLNHEMFRLILDSTNAGSLTLGEATVKAKLAVNDVDIRRTWILFGDPTMRLR